MSAAQNRTSTEQQIRDIEFAAHKAIQRPVKLNDGPREQAGPVVPHILQARLYETFSFDRAGEERMESVVQMLGVIIVFGACWVIGKALYAQL